MKIEMSGNDGNQSFSAASFISSSGKLNLIVNLDKDYIYLARSIDLISHTIILFYKRRSYNGSRMEVKFTAEVESEKMALNEYLFDMNNKGQFHYVFLDSQDIEDSANLARNLLLSAKAAEIQGDLKKAITLTLWAAYLPWVFFKKEKYLCTI